MRLARMSAYHMHITCVWHYMRITCVSHAYYILLGGITAIKFLLHPTITACITLACDAATPLKWVLRLLPMKEPHMSICQEPGVSVFTIQFIVPSLVLYLCFLF